MITVLGGSGYIGSAILEYFDQCEIEYLAPSRVELDYYNTCEVFDYLDSNECDFLINAAGYTGKPNVDACEDEKFACYKANVVLPHCIRTACEIADIKWMHISSGCIYDDPFKTFYETDEPNFCFESEQESSWYSGTKYHGERAAGKNCFILRVRIPLSVRQDSRNYIDKLLKYDQILNRSNSITWIEEFVANIPLFHEYEIEPGIYNMVNTGHIKAVDVLNIAADFDYHHTYTVVKDKQFRKLVGTPRSSCILSNEKSVEAGVKWSSVRTAIESCLQKRISSNETIDYRSLGLHREQLFEVTTE